MPKVGEAVSGRYEIQKVLGEGGFGAVYLATDLRAGGNLALKVLDPGKSSDSEFVKRFEQEVRVVRSLSHHHTIKIWDVGETEAGCAFMAMELVEGEPLTALIRRDGALPPERVLRIVKQVLQSLAEAHQKGVIHRDLKPDNIMIQQQLGEPDYVKVLDFGIAKAFGELSMVKTGTGVVLCTASYAAPELLRNRNVTVSADVYALGLIVLEMLTGRQAVGGDSLADIIALQMAPDPVPIPDSIVQQPIGALVQRATDKDPAERFQSADDMLVALEALPQSGDSPARFPDTLPQVLSTDPAVRTTGPTAPEPVREPSAQAPLPTSRPIEADDIAAQPEAREDRLKGRGLAVALVVIVAAVIALIVFLFRTGGESTHEGPPTGDELVSIQELIATHLLRHDPDVSGESDYDIDIFNPLGIPELEFAVAFDRSSIHRPPRRCFVYRQNAFCSIDGPLLNALVEQLDLGTHPELLDDRGWLELTGFGLGVTRENVVTGPEDLRDAAALLNAPPRALIAELPIHPPEVHRLDHGVEVAAVFNVFEEHAGWVELRSAHVFFSSSGEVTTNVETLLPRPELEVPPGGDERQRDAFHLIQNAGEMAERGDHGGAIDALSEALALDPGNPEAHRMLFENHSAIDQPVEAAAHLQTYLRLVPDEPNRQELEHILSDLNAVVRELSERPPRPEDGPLRVGLAPPREDLDRAAELLGEAERLVERFPGRAIGLLQEAKQLDPGNDHILFLLGATCDEAGHVRCAVRNFNQLLRQNPDDPRVPEIRERLEELERR